MGGGGACYSTSALHGTLHFALSLNLNLALSLALTVRPLTRTRRDAFEEEQEELDHQKLTHKVRPYLDVAAVALTSQAPTLALSPVPNLSVCLLHGTVQQHIEMQNLIRVPYASPACTGSL